MNRKRGFIDKLIADNIKIWEAGGDLGVDVAEEEKRLFDVWEEIEERVGWSGCVRFVRSVTEREREIYYPDIAAVFVE